MSSMGDESKRTCDSWMIAEQSSAVRNGGNGYLMSDSLVREGDETSIARPDQGKKASHDGSLGFGERAFSAAGAAVLSAVLVNPLDVVKTRLQVQAAGVPYSHPLSNVISRMAFFGPNMMFADLRCSPSCTRAGVQGTVSICPPDCFHYKGALDVFYKIIRQEGVTRLWRGTNAGLALAVPTVGIYLPCYDIFRNRLEEFTAHNFPMLTPYAPLVAGALSRSLACTSCYPIELARTRMQAFKEIHTGKKPPGVLKTLFEVVSNVKNTSGLQNIHYISSPKKVTTLLPNLTLKLGEVCKLELELLHYPILCNSNSSDASWPQSNGNVSEFATRYFRMFFVSSSTPLVGFACCL